MHGASVAVPIGYQDWFASARRPLMRTAYLLTGDQHAAEELVQIAMTKVYFAWDQMRSHASADAYARKVLVNENNSHWRRSWVRRETLTDRLPDHAAPADDTDDGGHLFGLVTALPQRQRAVLVLRYYHELSEAEIAELLGISKGAVKVHASRALAALRSRLPHDEPIVSRRNSGEEQ